jgi:hypothetical protein
MIGLTVTHITPTGITSRFGKASLATSFASDETAPWSQT